MEPKIRRQVSGSLTRHTNMIHARAVALAPKDRPWLSTQGIRKDTRGDARRVYTVRDETRKTRREPDGTDVGMHVEFGTSNAPPRPFLYPAFQAYSEAFFRDVESIVDRTVK